MWTYKQSTGALLHHGIVVAKGYSGHEWGKNNPAAENAPGIGPIPCGRWRLVSIGDSPNTGPATIVLHAVDTHPDDDIEERTGRGGFRIHGDGIADPGHASHGCIILARVIRMTMWNSQDHDLVVVP